MRKTLIALALTFSPLALAQVSNPSIVAVPSAPTGACSAPLPIRLQTPNGTLYTCQNGVWGAVNGSSGGTVTAAIIDKGGQVYNVKAYGAKVDGSTDDTAAVLATQAAAVAAGGGVVFIPAGTMITQPIQGAQNVYFMGAGTAQTIWQLIAQATPVAPSGSGSCSTTASLLIECWTAGWGVLNLTIDGNTAGGQTAQSHGIYISTVGFTTTIRNQPLIQNVTIQNTKTDGIHVDFASTGQGMFDKITVYSANGNGISAGGFDTQWANLNIGESGLQGLFINGASQHFTTVKSWFSGRVTPASGQGIVLTTGQVQCDSCEAQDNQSDGVWLDGASNSVFTGLVSTGNNRTSAVGGNGVNFTNAFGNVVVGNAIGGQDFPASQLYAVSFSGTSSDNHVRMTSATNVTGLVNGTITNEDIMVLDNTGTVVANLLGGSGVFNGNGALSSPAMLFNGSPVTSGGTASTTLPLVLIAPAGATNSSWSLVGTLFGINSPSGFTGNIFDYQNNGTSELSLSNGGTLTGSASKFKSYQSVSNCLSAASPAVCSAAPAGSVAVPAGTNPTLQVNTSAVTANSQILLQEDQGLGTRLSVTCQTAVDPTWVKITARTAGASFTFQLTGTFSTNPVCYSYTIVN